MSANAFRDGAGWPMIDGMGGGGRLLTYAFFGLHIGVFGLITFHATYGLQDRGFAEMFGGLGCSLYVLFFLMIFGVRDMLWMVIAALLGLATIYGWLQEAAGYFMPHPGDLEAGSTLLTDFEAFPQEHHYYPAAYLVLYEFLLRNAAVDLVGARGNPMRMRLANGLFLVVAVAIAGGGYWQRVSG